jgi:hypothetical protein
MPPALAHGESGGHCTPKYVSNPFSRVFKEFGSVQGWPSGSKRQSEHLPTEAAKANPHMSLILNNIPAWIVCHVSVRV